MALITFGPILSGVGDSLFFRQEMIFSVSMVGTKVQNYFVLIPCIIILEHVEISR